MDSLKNIMIADTDRRTAKKNKKIILKMIMKAKIILDKNILPLEEIEKCTIVCVKVLESFVNIGCPLFSTEKMVKFQDTVHEMNKLILDVIKKYTLLSEKNEYKLNMLISYLSSDIFLIRMFVTERVKDDRKIIYDIVKSILDNYSHKQEEIRKSICAVRGCNVLKTQLCGSPYCDYHHNIIFTSSITLQKFLNNQTCLNYFVKWLEKNETVYLYNFWKRIDAFFKIQRNKPRNMHAVHFPNRVGRWNVNYYRWVGAGLPEGRNFQIAEFGKSHFV